MLRWLPNRTPSSLLSQIGKRSRASPFKRLITTYNMSPHTNTSSPVGSYTPSYGLSSYRPSVASRFTASNDSVSSLSSSCDSSVMEDVAGTKRPLTPGVYVPTPCFFLENEDIDTETIAQHAVRLAKAGVTGLATQGSNGEAVHLTHRERKLVTSTTRQALIAAGFGSMPLIVGCGSQSTRETVELCRDAREAGGDYALVLPPSYYAGLFAANSATPLEFFTKVADESPIPIIIYNYPGGAGGLDLSSDVIVKLSEHRNIAGVKLTCGNTGKLNRIAAATRRRAKNYDPARPKFIVLAGSADFTIPALSAGGHGILAGLANISPKACVRVMRLHQDGRADEAAEVQDVVADGDWTAIQGGVVGTKAGLQEWMGYGGYARSPLPKPTPEQAARWKEGFKSLVALEKSL